MPPSGWADSHGCIRHYYEDITELFDITPVLIIYDPVKVGLLKGRVFIEVHEDIYNKIPDLMDHTVKLIAERQLRSRINWTRLVQAVEEKNGAPWISAAESAAGTNRILDIIY